MNTVFIVDDGSNPSLLRFTQTKLWYNYENQPTMWVKDCFVVKNFNEVPAIDCIVISTGDYCTTGLRENYVTAQGINDLRQNSSLIKFDKNYEYRTDKKPPYKLGDKQLYILQNLYKTVIKSRNLIYLSNTDDFTCKINKKNFYGLASGFKSVQYLIDNDIESIDQIIIYDSCPRQLEYAQWLHSQPKLPDSVTINPPYYGTYNPSTEIRNFWNKYHNKKVNFQLLDLMQSPKLLDNSFITASNIFTYEPNIFLYGWDKCKQAYWDLVYKNPSCTIQTNNDALRRTHVSKYPK